MSNIDGIINECTRRVVAEFHVEWEDCYQQAYLIALERKGGFSEDGGASFETYMFHQVYGGLRDYARRYLIKEQAGAGKRVDVDDMATLDTEVYIDEDAVSNKLMLEKVREQLDDVSRDVLDMVLDGYTQREIGEELKMSQPAINKRIQKIAGYISEL
jgi:RNA polymerase sigma factor (sigma-70 family)